MYAACPPKQAIPHIVFAAEPPDISTPLPSAVQLQGAIGVDQRHGPLHEALPSMNTSSAWAMHIHQRVADSDDVELGHRGRARYPAAIASDGRRDGPPTLAGVTNPYRLPRAGRPNRYELLLEPDLESATFAASSTSRWRSAMPEDPVVRRRRSSSTSPWSRVDGATRVA